MEALRLAIAGLEAEDDASIDPRALSSLVDRLQAKLCRVLAAGKKRGEHLLSGRTPTGWVAATCGLSPTSASDRLCVGEQLEAMPKVAAALSSGEVSYQKASVICHFRDRLREDLRELVDEEFWVERAREYSVRDLRSSSTCATGSTPTASIERSKRTGSSASFPSASRVACIT